ncbi:hypothetical protein K443DRAFT_14286 [Laccaria amethystina LaAM-08-1]|uniref:DUF6532 domain-containing protein n=1 Tax=Laccaria amethystina LaAM-08-1 TaxID=1095629 RepID=A0A0C9WN26_9AGAR|nr:hypothetical protein K443DRAFT_14286 [Laccaria amethystina LaAM-08-1]
MPTKSSPASRQATGATAQEKRRQTLERKKLQDQAQLRALESAGKQQRAALTKALGNAGSDLCLRHRISLKFFIAWIGAAPVGSQKRPSIDSLVYYVPRNTNSGSPDTNSKSTVTPQRPLAKVQPHSSARRHLPNKENVLDDAHVLPPRLSASKRLNKPAAIYRRISVGNSDEEPPEEDEQEDIDAQDLDDKDDEDGNQRGHEDEDEEGSQRDFEGLDPDTLKRKFANERVQWGREYGAQDDDEADGQDDDDNHPNFNRVDEHLDFGGDEEEEEEEEEEQKTRARKKIGKRGLERRAEQPTWKAPATVVNDGGEEPFDSANSDDDIDDEDADQEQVENVDPNANWEHARYVPAAPGARLISIRVQPPALRQIIRAAIRRVIGDAIFDHAYPSASDELTYYRKTLRSCARKLKYDDYAERFKTDLQFGIIVARLLNGRLSKYRSSVRNQAAGKVEGFYQLIEGQECKEQVTALCDDTSYIFPTKDGEIVSNKPFHHPALISMLRDVYFAGTRGSYAERYSARFGSSITEGPRKCERELPAPMVALAATAVHSSLDDYSSGICQKTEFMADLYEDVYLGHMTFLNNIKTESPDRYHRLMANLFNLASAVATRRSTKLTNNAMALLNLADMEV